MMKIMQVIFKQFRAEGGCLAYLIGDARTQKAILIDPRLDEMRQYEEFVAHRGLNVALVLDTHTHADHYSGSHLVAEEFGSKIAMGAKTSSKRPNILLKDGQTLEVGSALALRVLETPGHTPDSVSLILGADWGDAVFTGDTLFIGGSGRTDFPGADPAKQFESIHHVLESLEDSAFVLPGHDYSDLLFSTIREEKASNPHCRIQKKDDFIREKNTEALDAGGIISQIVNFNLSSSPTTNPRAGSHTACSSQCVKPNPNQKRAGIDTIQDALSAKGHASSLFVDVREPDEYALGHIPGFVNIPLGELLSHWRELSSANKVYVSCQSGNRSLVATRSLERLGLSTAIDLEGGLNAWKKSGLKITVP
jgi:glyoxylase-like metal-dependent hydrolase (beta-lactamase superfamily II)/rhodanese-related sulfurtransferase